ncbi:MAG: hypothetical protein IKX65_02160 [Prevotella sp.]|nr:hypothetical protein [Prevotella sp.]
MKITKNNYLAGFASVVIILALIRCVHPKIAEGTNQAVAEMKDESPLPTSPRRGGEVKDEKVTQVNAKEEKAKEEESLLPTSPKRGGEVKGISRFFNSDGSIVKHRILSVPRYLEAFPDSQPLQERAAAQWGVKPVNNRDDAEARKKELVYMGSSPFYHVDVLHRSVPYLVPRAAVLLNDIGRAYYDSLQIKGVPLHQFIVTSVLRTKEDVAKLRNYNRNATENSCHLYGTTFDICYNRYKTVQPPGEKRRQVQNDTLKWVLAEVLNDMRKQGRCYIKYEVKQSCFHITTR